MQDRIFRSAAAVTPHDSNASITGNPTGLYVGGAGAITCTMKNGSSDVVFSAVPAGATLNIRVSAIKATGTTATNILALYE